MSSDPQYKDNKAAEMAVSETYREEWLEDDFTKDSDRELFADIGIYLTALDDLDDVRNDPYLGIAGELAAGAIKEYKNKPVWSRDNAMFITGAMESAEQEKSLEEAVREIKREIKKKSVDSTAARWASEWHEKKNLPVAEDAKTRERRDFIAGAMSESEEVSEPGTTYKKSNKSKASRILRIAAIPAAAAIGLFVVLKTFSGPADAGKLFESFYEPMSVIAPVTRGANDNYLINYTSGLEKYRAGDYEGALQSFNEALREDINATEAKFFMGLSYLAKGDGEAAARLLGELTGDGSSFAKDAEWYLALAYLKTGEKEKAAIHLGSLAASPGYYREKAEKILRRLK